MGEQRFKVGDWVRVIDNRGAPMDYKKDDVCQVSAVRKDLIYCGDAAMFAKRFEPWQPRVGERVRVARAELQHKSAAIGLEFTVTKEAYKVGNGVQTWGGDNAGGYVWRADELEPILAPATPEQPATLKIEAGRFYKTRDGRKVGPMSRWSQTVEHPWEQQGGSSVFTKGGDIWRDDGTSEYDVPPLIAEWIDEPVAKPSNDNAKPKFKVGDRVKCLESYPGQFTAGKEYVVAADHFGREYESVKVKRDDGGSTENGWLSKFFELTTPTTTAIVALIESGQPKPSSTPHVHTSEVAAHKEATRLAAKYKGKKFGVFTLTATHEEAAPVYDHKWQNMAALGLKIDAIKELRAVAGLDLLSAKRAVEAFEQAA